MSTTHDAQRGSRTRVVRLLLTVILFTLTVTACSKDGGSLDISITGENGQSSQVDAQGFFSGLWDGLIAPFTGVASLFADRQVYDDRAGGGYPVGFGVGLTIMILILLGAVTGPRYLRRR